MPELTMPQMPPDVEAAAALCDQEPIHRPDSIQPHGLMLVAELDSQRVRHAAGAVEQHLGTADWQGRTVAALLGGELGEQIADVTGGNAADGFVGQLRVPGGDMMDVSAHRSGAFVVVELEPSPPFPMSGIHSLATLAALATEFESATTLQALCDCAAAAFRRLTGFDRVMVYRFGDDDSGRVLSESRREDLHSFLHHHFPASDIPRQARALYLRNVIRVIPDVSYLPAPLRPAWTAPDPLDMSDSSLRSVSPIHVQYLHNMGVAASASISIVRDGVLWGLIACHHQTPRRLSYDVRAMCRTLAGDLSRQIKAKEEAEGYRQRIRLRSVEDELIRLLSREGSLEEALSNHLLDISRMLDSDGIVILRGREMATAGVRPDEDAIRTVADWVLNRRGEPVFATDCLAQHLPAADGFRANASGLLAVTLSVEEPWLLLWFRAEQVQVVQWAGNPHKPGTVGAGGMLNPRASFDAWQETVHGYSRRWTLPEIETARRLRGELLDIRQNRRLQELNTRLTEILQVKDALLQQKEFLIGEVNHRVQNSLQLVSSFLMFQARGGSAEARATLEEARRRISAVALVHRRLYSGDQVQLVSLARYIEELCTELMASMGPEWAQCLTLDVSPVMIPTDRAVTLGLVLTELIINVNKYAYAGAAGPVEVRLREDRTNFQLVVADRGRGRGQNGGEAGKAGGRKGFGSRMMDGLVSQLGGTLSYGDNTPGLRAELVAPVEQPKRAA